MTKAAAGGGAAGYAVRMVRRIGYGLGLLFVLACALAYPLTWSRTSVLGYMGSRGGFMVGIGGGVVTLGAEWPGRARPHEGFIAKTVRLPSGLPWIGGELFPPPDEGVIVYCPLCVPALAASLLMAWRWRRGRTPRGVGFFVTNHPQ